MEYNKLRKLDHRLIGEGSVPLFSAEGAVHGAQLALKARVLINFCNGSVPSPSSEL